jgi:uncharacterized protein YndB with AHSA1/START domain
MTSNRILGRLQAVDGIGSVRMEDRFDTDIDDVWQALTHPARLDRWLGTFSGDLRLGGEFHARYHASGWEGTCRVEACDPPHHLRVANAQSDDDGDVHVTEVTLTTDGAQTIVVVEERGMPLSMLWAYGAGIQVHVEDLGEHLAGRGRIDSDARMTELIPDYQRLAADTGLPTPA